MVINLTFKLILTLFATGYGFNILQAGISSPTDSSTSPEEKKFFTGEFIGEGSFFILRNENLDNYNENNLLVGSKGQIWQLGYYTKLGLLTKHTFKDEKYFLKKPSEIKPLVKLLSFKYNDSQMTYTLGRFYYTLSPFSLFSPSNFFSPIDILSHDKQEPIDAFLYQWQAAQSSEIHFILLTNAKFLFRAKHQVDEVQLNLNVLGVNNKDTIISGDISTRLKYFGVSSEFALTLDKNSKGYFSLASQIRYQVPTTILATLELYVNGFGKNDPSEFDAFEASERGSAPYSTNALGQRIIGSQLIIYLTRHYNINNIAILNFQDRSWVSRLAFSITTTNHTLNLGGYFRGGEKRENGIRRSEHGDRQPGGFCYYKYIF